MPNLRLLAIQFVRVQLFVAEQVTVSSVLDISDMLTIARRGVHYLHKLNAANVPADLIEKGQNRVIDASLTLICERAKLKVYVLHCSFLTVSS